MLRSLDKSMREFLGGITGYVVIVLMFLLACSDAFAGTVTVSWTPPTVCADNSAITNCGTAYTKRAETPAATATSIQLLNVTAGPRCFYMKTLAGSEVSAESNRLCITVPASAPKAPVISVTIAIP